MKISCWKTFLLLGTVFLLAGQTASSLAQIPPPGKRAAEHVVHFQSAPGPLDNPLKGWCTYINSGAIHQPYSLVYQNASWKELEPREGEYKFSDWENKVWNTPLARGRHVIFRVYVDYPSKPSGIPDWLLSAGLKTRSYTDYGGGKSPDYDDPRLVAGLERLIAALGKRYDKDPRVAFVTLGTLGFWGEWHTYPHTDWFANASTQQRIVSAYHHAFPDKILMGRYAGDVLGQQPWLGYHDDLIPADTLGPEDWKFLPKMRQSGRTENWKVAVIGGEMEPGAADRWMGRDYPVTMTAINEAHMSWIGPYNPALAPNSSSVFLANSQAMVRRMGYQFALRDLHYSLQPIQNHKRRLSLTIHGENEGVAPFYYPWPIHLVLMNAAHQVVAEVPTNADIRRWLPGHFTLTAEIAVPAGSGPYSLGLGVVDPMTKHPAVKFADSLPVIRGWAVLTKL